MIKKLLKYTYILDVMSTPGLFINGKELYSDRAFNVEQVKEMIRRMMNKEY